MHIRVSSVRKESTYAKIITLVQQAQDSHAPLVRLADRYSTVFTIITLVIATVAYVTTMDVTNVLAVLVVATPCPLLLATPIALIGGMSASAKRKIIIKNLSSIEVLSRVDVMILDKTGTITLGRPLVTQVDVRDSNYTRDTVLCIAGAIEHNSLHPVAKAIVIAARESLAPAFHATNVHETIGVGITGTVNGVEYTLAKHVTSDHLTIELRTATSTVAVFTLEDQVKIDSRGGIQKLIQSGLSLFMLTGDKKAVADTLAKSIDARITVQANCTPEDKIARIRQLQSEGHVTAMVGDGINDAPALAGADVGMVFSNEEQTAASEAADIVFLGGDFSLVLEVLLISRRTIRIAMQSIIVGIGLSIISMILAAFGFIPPLFGSMWQEVIDVLVILNALRASR
jgi:heavy metal translocating P-type ATPase